MHERPAPPYRNRRAKMLDVTIWSQHVNARHVMTCPPMSNPGADCDPNGHDAVKALYARFLNTCPGLAPVYFPASITVLPLTMTREMPTAKRRGSS